MGGDVRARPEPSPALPGITKIGAWQLTGLSSFFSWRDGCTAGSWEYFVIWRKGSALRLALRAEECRLCSPPLLARRAFLLRTRVSFWFLWTAQPLQVQTRCTYFCAVFDGVCRLWNACVKACEKTWTCSRSPSLFGLSSPKGPRLTERRLHFPRFPPPTWARSRLCGPSSKLRSRKGCPLPSPLPPPRSQTGSSFPRKAGSSLPTGSTSRPRRRRNKKLKQTRPSPRKAYSLSVVERKDHPNLRRRGTRSSSWSSH